MKEETYRRDSKTVSLRTNATFIQVSPVRFGTFFETLKPKIAKLGQF